MGLGLGLGLGLGRGLGLGLGRGRGTVTHQKKERRLFNLFDILVKSNSFVTSACCCHFNKSVATCFSKLISVCCKMYGTDVSFTKMEKLEGIEKSEDQSIKSCYFVRNKME